MKASAAIGIILFATASPVFPAGTSLPAIADLPVFIQDLNSQQLPPAAPTYKIIGGTFTQPGELSFMAALGSLVPGPNYDIGCGGSLISRRWVLTAAHCVGRDAKSIPLHLGLRDQDSPIGVESFVSTRIVVHPDWGKTLPGYLNNSDHDFALIELPRNSSFKPITLNRLDLSDGIMLTTAGWGLTESNALSGILRKVNVPFVPADRCRAAYAKSNISPVTDRMICAGYDEGGKDSCVRDSGGPLFMGQGADRRLVGVVSWGEDCAKPGKYGVYSKVSAAIDWIESVIK